MMFLQVKKAYKNNQLRINEEDQEVTLDDGILQDYVMKSPRGEKSI